MNSQAPRDGIVLGTLALQQRLVTSSQLAEVLQRWLVDPTQSFFLLLVDSGYLTGENQRVLESLAAGRPLSAMNASSQGADSPSLNSTSVTIRSTPDVASLAGSPSLLPTVRDGDAPAGASVLGSRGEETLTELNTSNRRFRLLRPYAVGGLGIVSVAYDAELDREVAIKEMRFDHRTSDEAVGRFMTEAKLTGQLDHPGIPPVYALGYFENGRPFYAMRLIDGVTLKEAVAQFHSRYPTPNQGRERSLELRKLLGAFVSVCHTLRYAHSRNVLHRDIKPSNIMLGGFGETLVLDWGLAKSKQQSLPFTALEAKAHSARRSIDDPTLTGTGSVMGTPHYMSPEQARGEWDSVNLRSEVYSLGATLYTLLTGRLPFTATTREAVLEQVRHGQFSRPRTFDTRVPPELDAICTKAMALDREDRFTNAGELAAEIEAWLADEPVRTYRETVGRRWQRWLRSHHSAVAGLSALSITALVALTIGLFYVSFEHQRARREFQRAEAQTQRAERSESAAHDFIARFLVFTINNQYARAVGSERARLELLDAAIAQIRTWVRENPADGSRKLDLAEALREQANLFAAIEEPELAWASLLESIGCIDAIGPADGDMLHKQIAFSRLMANAEMAQSIRQRYGDAAAVRFLEPLEHDAQKSFDKDATDLHNSIALSVIQIQYAQSLSGLRRRVQATEVIDAAVTRLEYWLTAKVEGGQAQIFDQASTLRYLTAAARSTQAQIATLIQDRELALRSVARTRALCDELLIKSPDAGKLLQMQLEMTAVEAKWSCRDDRSEDAVKVCRRAVTQSYAIIRRFGLDPVIDLPFVGSSPGAGHRKLSVEQRAILALVTEIELMDAELELQCAHLTLAEAACSRGLAWIDVADDQMESGQMESGQMESDVDRVSSRDWNRLSAMRIRAVGLQAEIAMLRHDWPAAKSHCEAALRALDVAAQLETVLGEEHAALTAWLGWLSTHIRSFP